MEAASPSKMLVTTHSIAHHHNLQDNNPHPQQFLTCSTCSFHEDVIADNGLIGSYNNKVLNCTQCVLTSFFLCG
jgi:hypothetical protein